MVSLRLIYKWWASCQILLGSCREWLSFPFLTYVLYYMYCTFFLTHVSPCISFREFKNAVGLLPRVLDFFSSWNPQTKTTTKVICRFRLWRWAACWLQYRWIIPQLDRSCKHPRSRKNSIGNPFLISQGQIC